MDKEIDYGAIKKAVIDALPQAYTTISTGAITQAEAISIAVSAAIAEYDRQKNSLPS